MKFKNLVGLRINELLVTEHLGKNKSGQTIFKCICACGKECVKLSSCLTTGASKDCGCRKPNRLTASKSLGWEVFAKEISNKFPHYLMLDYSTGFCSEKWKFKCSLCNDIFTTSPNHLKRKGYHYPCSCRHLYKEDAVKLISDIESTCSELNLSFVKWNDEVYRGRSVSSITIMCNEHCKTKSITISEFLNKRSGLCCCSIKGFKDYGPAIFYLTRWESDEDYFYKYGITSNYKKRESSQKRKTDYKPLNTTNIKFNHGSNARELEVSVKSFCGAGSIHKSIFKDGYTETFFEDKLEGVLNIIQDYTRRFEYDIVRYN